jgi:serine/threonine protein kinase
MPTIQLQLSPTTSTDQISHISSRMNNSSTSATTADSTILSSISKFRADTMEVLPPPKVDTANATKKAQQDWWHKSIVRRSVPAIQTEVNHVVQASVFLEEHYQESEASTRTIPLFHRREIEIGPIIGTGGFSDVHAITVFFLDSKISERCTPEQQVLRLEFSESVRNKSMQLVVKQLKRRLATSSLKNFIHAACDLVLEATYMSALHHPHILPVRGLPIDGINAYDTGDYDGYFIIMDQLNGTLGDRIHDWKVNVDTMPSLEEKAGYALQVASALNYLHTSCHMVFRDLKPQNMGFDAHTGVIQLFDFGLCRELPSSNHCDDPSDEMNTVYKMSGVGTRRYMAPEIINDGKYNTKVDVYSWAMVVSELLTGNKPYANYGIEEHRVAVCQAGERPRLHFHWPSWLQTVLQKAWCECDDRWSMHQVVTHMTQSLRDKNDRCIHQLPILRYEILNSPVDVQQVHEFVTGHVASDWIYMPELPNLNSSDDNSSSTGSHVNHSPPRQQRRNTLQPRLERPFGIGDRDGSSSALMWDTDVITEEKLCQTGLTMFVEDGCIEVCPNVIINIPSSPKNNMLLLRAASCVT